MIKNWWILLIVVIFAITAYFGYSAVNKTEIEAQAILKEKEDKDASFQAEFKKYEFCFGNSMAETDRENADKCISGIKSITKIMQLADAAIVKMNNFKDTHKLTINESSDRFNTAIKLSNSIENKEFTKIKIDFFNAYTNYFTYLKNGGSLDNPEYTVLVDATQAASNAYGAQQRIIIDSTQNL
jgi:hypothetical protein